MRTGKIVMIISAVIITAGICIGRSVWAARHSLVTLHVRNAPLAVVAQAIEKQVHRPIRVDEKLNALISLDVNNLPLTNVLELLAEQAGARWGATYAVYNSSSALGRLESVFSGSSTLDAAGWTNLAPRFEKINLPPIAVTDDGTGPRRIVVNPSGGTNGGPVTFQSDADVQKFVKDKMKAGAVFKTEDVSVGPDEGGPGGGDHGPGKRVMVRMTRGPNGTTTTTTTADADGERVSVARTSADGVVLQEDNWSRERLMMETQLGETLGDASPAQANRKTAEQTAAKVHGKYAIYYALEKPPFGGNFRPSSNSVIVSDKNGTNSPMAELEAARRENMMGGLGKLSPEEQVRRAREMQEANGTAK